MTNRASDAMSGCASAFATISGPMPRGSPSVIAIAGRPVDEPARALDADGDVRGPLERGDQPLHRLLLRELRANRLAQILDGVGAAFLRARHLRHDELRVPARRILDP